MKNTPMKFVSLFTASLVMVGGFLAFPLEAKAERTKAFSMNQGGFGEANLCIKNVTQNREACTGNLRFAGKKKLMVTWRQGDKFMFKNNVVGVGSVEYGPLADRDTHCWSHSPINDRRTIFATCRMKSEAPW